MSPKVSRKVSFQAFAETGNFRFSFNHESRIFLSLLIETPLIEIFTFDYSSNEHS